MADDIKAVKSLKGKPLTAKRLRELVHYDPDMGVLKWRVDRAKMRKGAVCGRINHARRGYREITVDYGHYKAHRLAWLYVHGVWPQNDIDHINGITDDNRIVNLREATRSQNLYNGQKHKDGSAPYKGICWDKSRGKWMAMISVNGRKKHLGRFGSAEDARDAYIAAAKRIAGKFARFD